MNIYHEKTTDVTAKITLNIAPEDYNPQVDKVIKDQAKSAKIPGFRPGKVPTSHIRRTYGRSILLDEINRLVSDKLSSYIGEQKLEVLGQPLPDEKEDVNYQWDFNDNFEFHYEIGIAPEFETPFNKETEFTVYNIQTNDESVKEYIDNIRQGYGKMTNPEVSEDGDILYGKLQQIQEEDGLEKTTTLPTKPIKDEEIKKSLIGLKGGDKVGIDLKKAFEPAKISQMLNLTAEEVENLENSKFNFIVEKINRTESAELNEEFFKKVFPKDDITTEEEFQKKIAEELEKSYAEFSQKKLQNDLYTFGVAEIKNDFPEEFLKKWLMATNPEVKEEELNEGFGQFIENLKWTLIENKIMRDNDIEVKYEDVVEVAKEHIQQQFSQYAKGMEMEPEQMNQFADQLLRDKEQANQLFEKTKQLKVSDFLKENVKVNTQDIDYKEFLKLI